LVEVAQAGIFSIQGASEETLQPVLAMHCPAMLFPYARQAIASATMNAGFPPVQLQPINFEALYAQQLANKAAEAGVPVAAA
jgi:preprotein translocase subunit SecB